MSDHPDNGPFGDWDDPTNMSRPLSDDEARKVLDDDKCPRCGREVEWGPSQHERDSSYDWRFCPKCQWRLTNMATWDL
jgi:DNA-directed RNA polymerase subunit RPC12/RpoP